MATSWSLAIRKADLDARGARLNSGYLRLYNGSRPASVNTAITTQELVVTLRFGSTAFGAAQDDGTMTANTMTGGRGELEPSGTVTWGRAYESDGTTPVCDVNCATSGAEVNLDNTLIPYNVMVTISSLVVSELS
jgi:hypothetical protein